VNARVIIRPAVKEDLEAISRLRTESILETDQDAYSMEQLQQWAAVQNEERTLERIIDGCVLLGMSGKRAVATNGLDLDECEMIGLFVRPAFQAQGIGRRMVKEIERLAIRFGIVGLRAEAARPSASFYHSCGYRGQESSSFRLDPRTGLDCLSMTREFPQRQTRYGARIAGLLAGIGITPDYGRKHRLQLQVESRELATIGKDDLGREQMMHPRAAMAWYGMRNAARDEGITLQVASAFRSVGYQVSIIERKRQAGQSMSDILKVSAAPGYSEHHTGFALDICCPDVRPLEECFETTASFEWLTENAGAFGFGLSYPRNNRHGIAYEPWHWKFQKS
jgi:D-alanyl-D-alanine carboxypeptidase